MIEKRNRVTIVRCDGDRSCEERLEFLDYNARDTVFAARRAGWAVGPRGEVCPAHARKPCPDCGYLLIQSGVGGHVVGEHHRALVHCTERAVAGEAPVPPTLRMKLNASSLTKSKFSYASTSNHRRVVWTLLEFAAVECIEEAAPQSPAAMALVRAVAMVQRQGCAWWYAWALAHGADPDMVAERVTTNGRGFPWPDVGTAARVGAGNDGPLFGGAL